MPRYLCKQCHSLISNVYTFKSNCKKVEQALKNFLITGQLTKPVLKPIRAVDGGKPRQKSVESFKREAPASQKAPQPKRMKMEDNENVIMLNFTEDSQPETENDPEEHLEPPEDNDECVLGLSDISQDLFQSASASEGEQKSNKVVKTDCYACPHCSRSFPLKQMLDLHVVNHNRERSFSCDECDRKFFTKYDLTKHMNTHSSERPFKCVVCDKAFSREALLQRHEKIHTDVAKLVCTDCDKTFLTRISLEQHMEKHKKKRPYTCNICNKSFVFKQGLERHEVVHSEDKPHKCNYCEASFTSAIKLTRHLTSHAGLRPYPCKICGRTFLLSHHLTRHMRSHYAVESLSTDNISADTVIGQYKCDMCSMSFLRKDSLVEHTTIHSMVNLKCVICNTKFESADDVRQHINTHLSGLPFGCEKCDYSFESQEQLEEHEMKHAEMEYEEQIEKEVVMEAKMRAASSHGSMSEYEEDELGDEDDDDVVEFTISNDLNNPSVIRRSKRSKQEKTFSEFLRDDVELEMDEDTNSQQTETYHIEQEEQDDDKTGTIKPIIRSENTKVYTRKNIERKLPVIETDAIQTASLEEITQPASSIDDLGLSPEAINAIPNKKVVNMKLGDKVVRVQKYLVSKEEMKAMAKQGILEMKGGTVLLKKTGGQQILNATIKPVNDLDFVNQGRAKVLKPQFKKTYERKHTVAPQSTETETVEYIYEDAVNVKEEHSEMHV